MDEAAPLRTKTLAAISDVTLEWLEAERERLRTGGPSTRMRRDASSASDELDGAPLHASRGAHGALVRECVLGCGRSGRLSDRSRHRRRHGRSGTGRRYGSSRSTRPRSSSAPTATAGRRRPRRSACFPKASACDCCLNRDRPRGRLRAAPALRRANGRRELQRPPGGCRCRRAVFLRGPSGPVLRTALRLWRSVLGRRAAGSGARVRTGVRPVPWHRDSPLACRCCDSVVRSRGTLRSQRACDS